MSNGFGFKARNNLTVHTDEVTLGTRMGAGFLRGTGILNNFTETIESFIDIDFIQKAE